MEFPCNTYLFSYTDRKTDRLRGGKTDRQVINSSIFCRQGGGGAFVGGVGDVEFFVGGGWIWSRR